ncbi:uncharacterized protein MEPE_06164 [Melanopsichium pennsylvanicum]|uniref:Uncharacterized protein n=2 Tax=Melanopsichium pennsylvanicum TaxID=63383 RepID=A0AAJ4XRZ5_9BASI|nr:hypothetical protein BN887_01892 [Melanopsichium pennsylvanicum 4]SNX87454.1 uncharacterized protein MEPE_06164 [Melanopsichium pennsylvanicum]
MSALKHHLSHRALRPKPGEDLLTPSPVYSATPVQSGSGPSKSKLKSLKHRLSHFSFRSESHHNTILHEATSESRGSLSTLVSVNSDVASSTDAPTSLALPHLKGLRRYSSYLTIRTTTRKVSARSLASDTSTSTCPNTSLDSPSLLSTASAVSSATSFGPSSSTHIPNQGEQSQYPLNLALSAPKPPRPPRRRSSALPLRTQANNSKPLVTPPHSDSEYKWNAHQTKEGRLIWWRTVDAMSNFIQHWQHRFYNHGDMFASCTLSLSSPSIPQSSFDPADPCSRSASKPAFELTYTTLREAVRRLRWNHPTIALRLAKRAELGIEMLDIPAFIAQHVDLQVALVFDVLTNEAEVEAWLDEILFIHPSTLSRSSSAMGGQQEEGEFRSFLTEATKEGVPGRDRLRIHYWPSDANKGVDARVLIEQCHSVSEGIGTMLVFDLLLSSIASVLSDPAPTSCNWGEEVIRLEPALQDAIANPPESWEVGREELKQVLKVNEERMSGKSTPPNLLDRLGGKVISATLKNHTCSKNVLRSKVLNAPLVGLCRCVAENGSMLPLGLLPQTGVPHTGMRTHTDFISDTLNPTKTKALLCLLKSRGLTLAPFLEACVHLATTWVRKHRGLTPKGGIDAGDRILGSFSNAVSKRQTLKSEYSRYLGLCMSGFPTKIAASDANWSDTSCNDTVPSPTDPNDPLPNITPQDLDTLFDITAQLTLQYKQGRENKDWLRYDKALMWSTMQTEYLFLRDPAHYPSMPWLSSIGRMENFFAGSYPIASLKEGTTLEAYNMRLLGRVGIRQPILHVYSFRMKTTLQISFADWLYQPSTSDARKLHGKKHHKHPVANKIRNKIQSQKNQQGHIDGDDTRQNVLHFWLQVYHSLINAVLTDDAQK